MAAGGYKRNIFRPVPTSCQFTASSIQHVPGRLRTQPLVQMLAGGLPSFCRVKKCNRAKPRDEKRIPPGFVAHLLTHECRRESVEHGSTGASNALVSFSWQFTGYWTLVDDTPQNIYHIRSRIGYKRHAQISALTNFVVPLLGLKWTIQKGKQR